MNSRKIQLITFSIFLLMVLSKLQVFAQDRLSVGVSAQMLNTRFLVNISNFQTKGIYRPGSNVFIDYKLSRKYTLRSGIGYSMITQNSDVFKNNINYLAIPLYLKTGNFKEFDAF